jgi:hypothetical protein
MAIHLFAAFQTCERERRHREQEARMARHRQMEEERNQRALERALAPPFIKVLIYSGISKTIPCIFIERAHR